MMMAVGMERTGCPRDAGAREGADRSGHIGVGGERSCSGLMMPPASSTPETHNMSFLSQGKGDFANMIKLEMLS